MQSANRKYAQARDHMHLFAHASRPLAYKLAYTDLMTQKKIVRIAEQRSIVIGLSNAYKKRCVILKRQITMEIGLYNGKC